MNTTIYFPMAHITLEGSVSMYLVPQTFLPRDIENHFRGTAYAITPDRVETIKKTHHVFIIHSIQPFKSQPSYRAIQFLKDHGETFQSFFNKVMYKYRQAASLSQPIHYEQHSKKSQVKKVVESSACIACEASQFLNLKEDAIQLTRNNQEFFRALLRLPLIDQISPETPFFVVWQFLANLILKKTSLEIKKSVYIHQCELHRLVMLCCVRGLKKSGEAQFEFLSEQISSIKHILDQLISCVVRFKRAHEQLKELYQPLIIWMDSLLELKTSEARINQIMDWEKNLQHPLSEHCVQVNQYFSSREYLMRWVRQNIEVLNTSLIASNLPNAANHASSILKALFFHDFHEINRIILEVKASSESLMDLKDLDNHKFWFVSQTAGCFLQLISSLIDKSNEHKIISSKVLIKTIKAKEIIIENLSVSPLTGELKPLRDWAIAIKKTKAVPQYLIQLELLSRSWKNLKSLCEILSENRAIGSFLTASRESSDKKYMAKTYFEAVEEINLLLEKFNLCLNQINDQVAAFQALCLLIKSDKRLPQIETASLINQFDEMNGKLTTFIQPTVDFLNGFQHILQLDGEVKKIVEAASELTLKFRAAEVTVHLFATDPQLYEKFDEEVLIVEENGDAIIEIDPINDEIPELAVIVEEKDSFEERINEIFTPKKSERIKKHLFEFLKEEKIDFKTLFGKGDHLKLYLNGRSIPLPKHTEWKPGTKTAIKREIIKNII